MGNQKLCDLIIFAVLSYLILCLCLIGRPSLAVTFLRSIRHAKLYFSSSRTIPSSMNEAGGSKNLRC
jgi:hypothetical protein